MKSYCNLIDESLQKSAIWIEKAKADMETVEKMLKAEAYDCSTFLCQQSVEKLLKGIFILEKQKFPPHIHGLKQLAKLLDKIPPENIFINIELIDKFYIPSRYPEERLSEQQWEQYFTNTFATDLFKKTKEVFLWYSKEYNFKI